MHVLAAFFDPGNDGLDVGDYVVLTVAVAATLAGGRAIWRRWKQGKSWSEEKLKKVLEPIVRDVVTDVVRDVMTHVDRRTDPIQPEANSGDSLPDNNRMTEWIVEGLITVAKHVGVALADLPPKPITRQPRTHS
jgi:hypothetical protein